MSWQTYVDSNLVGSGKVTRAAILGQQGGVWATSKGFELSVEEQNAVIAAFSDLGKTQSSGLKLAGAKYFAIQTNPRSIYLKKQADGAAIVKTKQAILVGLYQPPLQAAECTPVVESLADYLINAGY